MTTQQQLLEQAKQGEPRALALLIANSLKAQGLLSKLTSMAIVCG
jgi:hypothetical protein